MTLKEDCVPDFLAYITLFIGAYRPCVSVNVL